MRWEPAPRSPGASRLEAEYTLSFFVRQKDFVALDLFTSLDGGVVVVQPLAARGTHHCLVIGNEELILAPYIMMEGQPDALSDVTVELWANATISAASKALIEAKNAKTTRYSIAYREGEVLLSMIEEPENRSLLKTYQQHFSNHPLAVAASPKTGGTETD